ncbi:hypothetical protein HELRODRAFT_165838 [Helobdella robusta]|uniref:Magnesium transporter protein 1 n=1 Tax=Helobdella robusta TaxID=6412 RepID=T1EXC5_HELRO|nr:hypothetical protein HELRODRAFT_165838 [Helobdella robusta]ESN91767.1 hypothetical protein HELRODRAFT_165838 [Helobdella robusta]
MYNLFFVKITFFALTLTFLNCNAAKEKTNSGSDKLQQVLKFTSQTGYFNVDGHKFKSYVKTSLKPYGVFLLLSVSMPERKCSHCGDALESFKLISSSWRFSEDFENDVFFGFADFDAGGMDVFQSLQIRSAPVMLYFPPYELKYQSMMIEKYGLSAEGFANFLQRVTSRKIIIKHPPNYTVLMSVCASIAVLVFLFYMDVINIKLINTALQMWSGATIVMFILLMISGFMWNHMRRPPLVHEQENSIIYIEHWGDGQLLAESFIIFFLNLLIGIGIVLLAQPRTLPITARKWCAYVGISVVCIFFYFLLGVFKKKYEGYPYGQLS